MRSCLYLLTCLCLAGCASDGTRPVDPEVDLYSPSGARRAQAVQIVAADGDVRYVSELIRMLDDRDGTVRLQAHAALKALTGHDTGYVPYCDRRERAEHVRRWEAWWQDDRKAAPADAPADPADAPADAAGAPAPEAGAPDADAPDAPDTDAPDADAPDSGFPAPAAPAAEAPTDAAPAEALARAAAAGEDDR